MKKLPFIIAVVLLMSSIAAIGFGKEAEETKYVIQSQTFGTYTSKTAEIEGVTYLTFEMQNAPRQLYQKGKPMIPFSSTTFTLPLGTKITNMDISVEGLTTSKIAHTVLPAPEPVIRHQSSKPIHTMDATIYEQNELFPHSWASYTTGGGRDENNNHVTFVTVNYYPLRYNPLNEEVQTVEDIKVQLTYEEPETALCSGNDEYDLVIISPEMFSEDLQELIDHKNSYGIKTYLKTTEEIYNEFTGVDEPEQIKYFIKDALDTYDIDYVLLVGGLNSLFMATPRDDKNKGVMDWLLPVRYTNNKEMGSTHDPGFISDLYYADIYDGEGNFSSWDNDKNGNSDGIFANWKFGAATDYLDLYPDVYVGRLACRNSFEVSIMVEKIITYETTTYSADWFNRMIGVGGDSHADSGTEYDEGEVVCDYVFDTYMSTFDAVKLYSSHRESDPTMIPSEEGIVREVSTGAGFLLFDGHGHPGSWNTHWHGEHNWQDTPGGVSCYDFMKFENDGKYPICVIGGCHNSQFNISLINTVLNKPYMWTHGQPFAECFGWWIVRAIKGGAIASMGNTGLGYGAVGNYGDLDGDGNDLPDTVETLGGYQELMFFEAYNEGKTFLGEVWGGAETKYLNTFPGMEDQTDCKTVTQWPLLGDPSLKIGGYE